MNKLLDSKKYHINYSFKSEPKLYGSFLLYQVGKMFCEPMTVINSHTHINWFELTIVLAGKGEIYTNREKISVSEGDIVLSFPYDIHKIVSNPNSPLKFSFIAFHTLNEDIKQKFDEIFQLFYESEKRVFHDSNVEALTEMLISEISSSEYEQNSLIENVLHSIVILIIRDFLYKEVKSLSNYTTPSEVLCHKIMRYIDSNLFSLENLSQVAEHFHHNYAYLSKKFKQTTNLTLTQYLVDKKLERAKILIKEGKLTFTEIAELLHYASLYSFSKSFKFHFGISPSEYRNIHKPTSTNEYK